MISQAQLNHIRGFAVAAMKSVFPARIEVGGRTYTAATTGLAASDPLADGGADARRQIAFVVRADEIGIAARPGDPVVCSAPAALAGTYALEETLADPSGTAVTLRCSARPQ